MLALLGGSSPVPSRFATMAFSASISYLASAMRGLCALERKAEDGVAAGSALEVALVDELEAVEPEPHYEASGGPVVEMLVRPIVPGLPDVTQIAEHRDAGEDEAANRHMAQIDVGIFDVLDHIPKRE